MKINKRVATLSFFAILVAIFIPILCQEKEIENKPAEVKEQVKVEVINPLTETQTNWIKKLVSCESGGRTDIKIVDSNGKYSYGAFQFQMDTFLGFGKRYGVIATSTTPVEAESLIFDYKLQESVASKMLNDSLESHWLNCSTKIGIKYPHS